MSGAAEDIEDFAEDLAKGTADLVFPGTRQAAEEVQGAVQDLIPKPPKPPQPPSGPPSRPDPGEQAPEIKAAVDQARKRLRAARGRSRTILTAGSTLGEPNTRRRTILGG